MRKLSRKQKAALLAYELDRDRPAQNVKLSPIFRGEKRKHVVSQVMDIMRDWRLSPFENEGPAISDIRSGLCLMGNGWTRSDMEAHALVDEGLRLIGAQRPSWSEGQGEYAAPRTNCLRCGGDIDEVDQISGRRFCSGICAKAFMIDRAQRDDKQQSLTYRRAWSEARDWAAAGRTCKQCDRIYHSAEPRREFCSERCAKMSFKVRAETDCAWCAELFYPRADKQKCCSLRCDGFYKADQLRRHAPEQDCPICKSVFRPAKPGQVYCSRKCARSPAVRLEQRKRAETTVRRGDLSVPEVRCPQCDGMYRRSRTDAKFCSTKCTNLAALAAAKVRDCEAGKPVRISPRIFDFVLRINTRRPDHRLTPDRFDQVFKIAA